MRYETERPKISVIVPVYGEDKYLPSCIESIQDQTYKNLEIILVDDGSPDRCPQICDQYARNDDRIRVIHKMNAGLVEARKTGIRLSTGEYIAYVDGDDIIEVDFIERMVEVATAEEVDVVIAGFCKNINGSKIRYLNNIPCGRYDKDKIEERILPCMISNNDFYSFGIFTYVWNKLFKREILFHNQLSVMSQLVIGEDSSCVYPTLALADSVFITDYCGYHYRQRAGSLLRLRKNKSSMIDRLMECRKYLYNRFLEIGYKSIIEKQIDSYIYSQMIMLSDCLVGRDSSLEKSFPFSKIETSDRVIIYSAGAFGMHLYCQYKEYECCKLVALCDPDYMVLDDGIISIEEAIKNNYDKIIVASIDRAFIEESRYIAQELGIEKNKVVTIDDNLDYVLDYCRSLTGGL